MRRLVVAGGGTGGHVTPLLAVLEALQDSPDRVDVRYLGSGQSIEERLAQQHGVPFTPIPVGAVRGLAPWQVLANLGRTTAGVYSAWRELRRFRPDAVLVTGGYVSVPVAMGARLARTPVVVCLPDMEPGLAVRLLARLAATVTVSFDEVKETLPAGKAVATGYPVRRAFLRNDRARARQRLGIAEGEKVLVVLGGSRGARSLNEAVMHALPSLLELARVCHITGTTDFERVQARRQQLGTCVTERYDIYSYVDNEMADLLWAADLVLARAGASTLGEFPLVGVPSILVPYPYAGGHQTLNATYLQDRGAAVIVEDGELQDRLLPVVRTLLEDPQRLAAMAEAARRLARPQASRAIVAELERAANGRR